MFEGINNKMENEKCGCIVRPKKEAKARLDLAAAE